MGSSAIIIFFFLQATWQVQVCHCCKIYTSYILLYTSSIYISTYHTTKTAAVFACYCVLCPCTAQCAQCLAAFSIPPRHVNWRTCLNSQHVLETRQHKQSWRASQTERTTQHPRTPHDAMLFPPPPVVLEKRGCCNAVTEARLPASRPYKRAE